ncbi:MAG: DUF3108 domain-containing protein, partial [Anaerolineales bacterium]
MIANLIRRAALPLLLVPSLALPAAPAAAIGAELTYEVWSNAMQVMNLVVSFQADGESYSVELKAELMGPPAWFESYRLRSGVEGRLADGGPQPVAYRTEARTDSKKVKWIELAFEQPSQPAMSSDPPFSPHIRPALDEAALAGSRDPLSAIFALLQATDAAGTCNGESKVYDGRRRFDLKMMEHDETLPADLFKPAE